MRTAILMGLILVSNAVMKSNGIDLEPGVGYFIGIILAFCVVLDIHEASTREK